MLYPQAYINYLVLFHGHRDYFECHEVLEEHWKNVGFEKVWIGLIQLAVALYHDRRGNKVGANRMMITAKNNIIKYPVYNLGIDQDKLLLAMTDFIDKDRSGDQQYFDLNIPIHDDNLLQLCQRRCEQEGLTWCAPSNMDEEFLIHKHKLRDRTEVIVERQKQLELRKK